MNVFEFALKMEEDGKTFYETLAAETSEPELKRIFSLLASAEEEHRKAIESIKNDTAPGKRSWGLACKVAKSADVKLLLLQDDRSREI